MLRLTDIILVFIVVAGAAWTYQIKYEAENSADRLRELNAKIAQQNEKIVLLQADWAIMTGPERLSPVAEAFKDQLQLSPLKSEQIITLDELPEMRPEEPVDKLGELLEANRIDDGLTTGSIKKQEKNQ